MVLPPHPQIKLIVKGMGGLCLTCGLRDSLAYLLESFGHLFQVEKHSFNTVSTSLEESQIEAHPT